VFGTAGDTYVTSAIGPDRPFQQILHAEHAGASRDTARRIPVPDGKLTRGTQLDDTSTVGAELWCVVGPEFYDACQ
jgi:hypothetical protein